MVNAKSSTLTYPRLGQLTAFMLYIICCWLSAFIIPLLWGIFLKISCLYFYLTTSMYLFFYISTICMVILYLALIFQAATYNPEFFQHQPSIEIIDQQYNPKIKAAALYLARYLGCSYLISLCFYTALIFAIDAQNNSSLTKKNIPSHIIRFYDQNIENIIFQQIYDSHSFIHSNLESTIWIYFVVLSILYFLILIFFYGGPIFSPLVKVLQRDLWRIND